MHHVSRGFAALLAAMTLGCVLLLTGAAQASPASAAHAAMAHRASARSSGSSNMLGRR